MTNGKLFMVDNYLEAAGVMTALKAGVSVPSVRRPLAQTVVATELLEGDAASADKSDAAEKAIELRRR